MASAKNIEDSLIKQLEEKGANVDHFLSLVDDYVWYWNQEKLMQKDIEENGFLIDSVSASGKEYKKENSSVKNAVMYNKQKLAILKQLELTTNNAASNDDDEL